MSYVELFIFMAALHSRCGHCIFALLFLLSSIFFSFLTYYQPSQIVRLPYFHTWCGLNANLGCRSETCCAVLAEMQDAKNSQKFAICAPLHKFAGLYLRN